MLSDAALERVAPILLRMVEKYEAKRSGDAGAHDAPAEKVRKVA